jgi:hypothetical protein
LKNNNEIKLVQVHTKRRNRLLLDRMRDLVFVKFNSILKQKKDNKDRDPLERPVHDALGDEDNEWITGIEPLERNSEEEGGIGASSQGVAAAPQGEERTNRGYRANQQRGKKRKRLIPTFEDEESSPSSGGEDNNDIVLSDSDSEVEACVL